MKDHENRFGDKEIDILLRNISQAISIVQKECIMMIREKSAVILSASQPSKSIKEALTSFQKAHSASATSIKSTASHLQMNPFTKAKRLGPNRFLIRFAKIIHRPL